MKNKIFLGIDPDIDKSGFALTYEKTTELTTLSFFQIFNRFTQLIEQSGKENIIVYIECGFLNKSNWHKK